MGLVSSSKYFSGEFKSGIFAKTERIYIDIEKDRIHGRAYVKDVEWDFTDFTSFDILLENVISVKMITFEKNSTIEIKTIKDHLGKRTDYYLYLIALGDIKGAYDYLLEVIENYTNYTKEQERLAIEEQEKKYRDRVLQMEEKQKSEDYYKEIYSKYIGNDDIPHYVFESDDLKLTALYIDENKNINIISVDGNERDYTHGIILEKNIHYYEKAGSIHYTTMLNVDNKNFGGSFKPAQWKVTPAILGGLLFGTLGMTVGMMKGYQPSEMKPSQSTFKISSDIEKIDDRSVILNYYSEAKREYVDIELPQDVYNYLQTYLPEKKYDIVLEIEKKQVSERHSLIEKVENENLLDNKERVGKQTVSIEEFKEKIEKLNLMKDAGLLSEDEFMAEKNKLLSLI